MLKPINVGVEFFHKLIESNSYYVDKTDLIRTVFKDDTADVMLITRPRRFGKTLTMTTFWDFLSLDPLNPGDTTRQNKWFQKTAIFADKEFCREYMGKFPVIFLTLKSVGYANFQDSYNELAFLVSSLAKSFTYLKSGDNLDEDDKQAFSNLLNYELLRDPKDKSHLANSLKTLTELLAKYHGINPILLIDEYDVPIAKAAHHGYYREMIDVISPFLSNALKTNPHLGKAVLTGCLRAAKESIFTGLNNLSVCSVLDPGDMLMSTSIGFTDEETRTALAYYGLSDCYQEVQKNYDGYHFGGIRMYCPWDVMSFCRSNRLTGAQYAVADNYWINTSGNDIIEEFMGFIQPDDTDKMQDLLDGKTITVNVRKALCYGDLQCHNISDFWTLLLYTGYLTYDPRHRTANKDEYLLYIPNEEIRDCFRTKIKDFIADNPVMKNTTSELITAMFEGDAGTMENRLNTLLAKYVSVRDFATKAPRENYYHGFMNGLLVNGISLIEEQKSNAESGDGYTDLIILSAATDRIAILELKTAERKFDDRISKAEKAIEQIISNRYAEQFMDNKTIKAVYVYGICFYKKNCSVQVRRLK